MMYKQKNKLSAFFSLFIIGFHFSISQAQTKHIKIEYHLIKEWTEIQHRQLCWDLCLMLDSGKIKPVKIKNENAIKLLTFQGVEVTDEQMKYYDFFNLSTDTLLPNLDICKRPLITKQKGLIYVQSEPKSTPVIFKENEWNKFINSNESRQIFWHFFFDENQLNSDSFSNKTDELIKHLATNLIIEINKGEDVFKNPEFTKAINKSVDLPAKEMVILYISTDPEDPTIGYDSTYTVDALQNIKNGRSQGAMNVWINTENLRSQIVGMNMYFGSLYIKFDSIDTYTEIEKRLIRILTAYALSKW